VVIKLARLFLVGLLFGLAYVWVAPVAYRADANPGFWVGSVHGALMPVALPSLLMGKDVPIYAHKNQGRIYKLGYIAGINVCGFIFFGLSFWQPGRPRCKQKAGVPPPVQ
jgi:hypothetical protein